MSLNQDDIREILDSGDFTALKGEFESEQLECKRKPYPLDTDKEKLELAKDVSALANAKGGVILVGCETKRDPTHYKDRIERTHLFEQKLFDRSRYHQVLEDWLWPPLHNLEIDWFPSAKDTVKGIAAIFVKAAEGPGRPVLITKTILDSSRRTEILFGYCERKLDKVIHYDIQRLQTLLRDGSRLDGEIREWFQSLQSTLEDLRVSRPNEASVQSAPVEFNKRLLDALWADNLHNEPSFTLGAYPMHPLNLRELFESRDSDLVRLLENPPKLRDSGFDLSTNTISRIVEGRLRRVSIDGYKLLEFHRDGTLIFVTRGDTEGLCWGRHGRQQGSRLINQLALIETTFLFCKLAYVAIKEKIAEDRVIEFDLRIYQMNKNGQACGLETGPLSRQPSLEVLKAPGDFGTFSVTSVIQEDPARIAFRLVAEVYAWFGIEGDQVPYSKLTATGRVIDEDQLASVDRMR